MASAATVVCSEIAYSKIVGASHSCHPMHITLEGDAETWSRMILSFADGELVLTSLVRRAPGDKFSKLVLSMHNLFRTANTDAVANKTFVLKRIENATMMIGVVATPEFSDVDSRLDCLWRIAEEVDAVVFNGEAILNLRGQRIMSRNGEHDLVM